MNKISFHPSQLGNFEFKREYGLRFAYQAGAMANGISSTDMVIALSKAGYLGSFGAGGLSLEEVERAINIIQTALPKGPYLFNLLHSHDPGVERKVVDLYLQYKITAIEASAFVNITPNLVYYRAAGLSLAQNGQILVQNRIIAKISRAEVAEKFMRPPDAKILNDLVQQQCITGTQAELAANLPLADDITVEADSGGHTDKRVLTCLFPTIKKLVGEMQQQYRYATPLRVGAAGGISTPEAAAAAFMLGADYILTGSVNQCAVEAGTSLYVKELLAQADMNDTAMCPSADMFEMGAKVQVLKRGTLYAFRAEKLHQLYRLYNSLEEIPEAEIKNLEKTIFQKNISAIWQETITFFSTRSPEQITRAEKNPKLKMALIFRWYLGQSSAWAIHDSALYRHDYQIWCGPAMGAFNQCVKNTPLANLENRSVTRIAEFIMQGAASFFQNQFDSFLSSSFEEPKMKKLTLVKSIERFEASKKHLPGGVHYNFKNIFEDLVIPFHKGFGSRIWDIDGNEHLDLVCKFGALIVGHCNPRYNEVLKNSIDKLTSVDNCGLENQICEKLCELIPCAEMVRFGLSGSESIQNALRLARAYSGKKRLVRFMGHYHGSGDNVIGGKPARPDWPVPEPFAEDIFGTDDLTLQIIQNQSFILPWNDIAAFETLVRQYGHEIGATIMEPICFNGGGILPQPGYLNRVREICDKNNIVLIFDEIITGFRVALGGAQSLLGVTPDLAVFGKALAGGGVPVSLIAGKKEIMELYSQAKVVHLGTFNGYPLGLAAIAATLELLSESGCYERMGSYLLQIGKSLIAAAKAIDLPMVVQGMPTALVYHLQNNHQQAADIVASDSELEKSIIKESIIKRSVIRKACKEYGIQLAPTSRLYANLMLNQSDVDFFEQRIGEALTMAKGYLNYLELI